ncbi:MAG: hypothetical protein HKN50_05370 [Gammaproteobacteria bacterium]|nr:hypothetical protein [Gammaproteobacteria bacterium]
MTRPVQNFKNQRGAVFATTILVLVVLLVTSILGLTAVDNATLQTRIARNVQQKQLSFHNAETAAGLAEIDWKQTVGTCFLDLAACTTDFAPPYVGEDIKSTNFWANKDVVEKNGVRYGYNVIEHFGKTLVPGEDDRFLHFYRVTSIGQDRVLQQDTGDPDSFIQNPDASSTSAVQTMIMVCVMDDGSPCEASTAASASAAAAGS